MRRFLFQTPVLRNADGGSAGGDGGAATAAAASADPAPASAVTATPSPPEQVAAPSAPASPPASTEPPKTETAAPAPLNFSDIKLPEALKELKEDDLKDTLAVLNDTTLSAADRTSKLLELHAAAATQMQQKLYDDWNTSQKARMEAMAAHPEFGGAKYTETQAAWNRVLTEFGDKELRDEITTSGIGNSPAFGKFLLKVAAMTGEGKPVVGAPTSSGSQKSAAELMYPDHPRGV